MSEANSPYSSLKHVHIAEIENIDVEEEAVDVKGRIKSLPSEKSLTGSDIDFVFGG